MDEANFIKLYAGGLIPLRTVLPCLTWILHDYFLTIEDEVRYIWTETMLFEIHIFMDTILFNFLAGVRRRPNPSLCSSWHHI